ncbi:MAG: hypothetical protein GHCLOJNM_01147 [bacterium]|nr:hypothetical protein [bacterium]
MTDFKVTRQEFLAGLGSLALGGLALGDPLAAFGVEAGGPGSTDLAKLPLRLQRTECLKNPIFQTRSLALDSQDRLLLAGDGGVALLGPGGVPLKTFAEGSPATSAAVDEEGLVYVGRRTRIEVFDPNGKPVASWGREGKGDGELRYVTDITVVGLVAYVADAGNRRVTRFAVDGDYISDLRGFNLPSAYFDCVLDPEGNLLVANTAEHRIETYGSDGEKQGEWGKYGFAPDGFCGCCNPTHIAVFPDGKVATSEKGVPRIKVHDSKGTLLAYLSPEDLGLRASQKDLDPVSESPEGPLPCHDGWPGMPMAVDSMGRLVVSLPDRGEICYFELAS